MKMILAFALLQLASAADSNQTLVWNPFPGFVKQISAKGDHLWAITPQLSTIRWLENKWHYIASGGACQASAATDGNGWVVGRELINSWRWLGNPNAWNWAQDGVNIVQVNFLTGTNGIAVNINGEIYRYKSGWIRFSSVNNAVQASIGEGDEIWMVDLHNNIFRWNGNGWDQTPGNARFVDVQSASRVVVTDMYNNVYRWNKGDWLQLEGVQCYQATIGASAIYCMDPTGSVYKLDA